MTNNTLNITSLDDGTAFFDEINGNWDEVRQFLDDQTRGFADHEALTKSIEANSRAAQVALFGGQVQIVEAEQNRGLISVPTRGGTVARVFWWGFHIEISHEDIQGIISAADGATILIDAISPIVPSVVRPFLAVARIFLEVSKAVLQALDRGRGVYISMSWFAPGIFVPTSV